jgi:hypothetical protein
MHLALILKLKLDIMVSLKKRKPRKAFVVLVLEIGQEASLVIIL